MTVEKGQFVGRKKLNIVPIGQKEDFTCGTGVVSNLLLITKRAELITDDLDNELKYDPEVGTLIENIVNFLERNQIGFEEKIMANLDDLEESLRKGNVCMIEYQAWGTEEEKDRLESGHYSIIFGMDEESVWLVDSAFGVDDTLGIKNGIIRRDKNEFYRRWFDGEPGGRYDHWMVSVKNEV